MVRRVEKIRILRLEGSFSEETPIISSYESPLGPVTVYRYRKAYGFTPRKLWFWDWELLDKHYKIQDQNLIEVYEQIRELSKSHDVLYHAVGDMMHPDFIKTLDIKTIYCVDGEPASSKILSHPVVHAYDFALTCSTNYDDNTTCVEQLINHGAKQASHVICGTKYPKDHRAWKFPIDGKKDIDVVFLGGDMTGCDPLLGYPPNKYIPIYNIMQKLPDLKFHVSTWTDIESAADIYKRSKIGIVLHGPSQYGIGNSQRLYDLAASGVMIMSDGIDYGVGDIFHVGNEINAFSWKNMEVVPQRIRDYLAADDIRINMATAARKRCYENYRNDKDDNWMLRGIKIAIKAWGEDWLKRK